MPTVLNKSAAAAAVGMINAVGSIAGFAGPYPSAISIRNPDVYIWIGDAAATTIVGGLLCLRCQREQKPVRQATRWSFAPTGALGSVE
jgi:hypothetical protein